MDKLAQVIFAIAACIMALGLCEVLIQYVKRKYPNDGDD